MADSVDRYQVIYQAIANFSSFSKESKKARAELKQLKKDQEDYNKAVVKGAAEQSAARELNVRAINKERGALERATRALKEHARAAAEDAAATEADAAAHERLARAGGGGRRPSRVGGGDSAGTSQNVNDTNRQSRASRDLTSIESALAGAARDRAKAEDDAAGATRRSSSATEENGRASRDLSSILGALSGATKQHTDDVRDNSEEVRNATKVVDEYRRGVRGNSDEVQNAIRVLAQHRASLRADMNAARQRLGGQKEEERQAIKYTGIIGLLNRALVRLGSSKGTSGSQLFDGLIAGAAKAESRVKKLGSGLASFLKIGSILSLIGPLIAALQAGGAAAIGFGTSIASIGGAAVAALPGIFALISGIGALVVAFQGIGGAFKGFFADQKTAAAGGGGGGGVDKTTKALDNQADAAWQLKEALWGVKEAQHGVSEAQDNLKDSYDGLKDAEADLVDSQTKAMRAQQDLNEARVQAKRDLEDLMDAVRGAPADEAQALAKIQLAKENLANIMAAPGSTLGDQMQAQADLASANDDYHEQQRQQGRDEADLAKAQKQGIEGSDGVVSAKDNLVDAQKGVQDAKDGIVDAQKQIADAKWGVIQANHSLLAAEHAVTQAQRAGERAADALAGANAGGAGAVSQFDEAMKKLSPNAQKFVRGLLAQRGAWRGLRDTVQDNFFGKILPDLGRIRGMVPTLTNLLGKAAGAMGDVAHEGIVMVSSGPWKKDFGTLADNNVTIIKNMGSGLLSVLDGFRHVAVAAGPFTKLLTKDFKDGAANFASFMKESRDNGRLANWLTLVHTRAGMLWRGIKNVAQGFLALARAAGGFNTDMLSGFEKSTQKFEDWSRAQEKYGSKFKQYLQDIRPLLTSMGNFFRELAVAFGHIGSDRSNIKAATHLFDKMTELLPGIISGVRNFGSTELWRVPLELFKSLLNLLESLHDIGVFGLLEAFAKGLSIIAGAINLLGDAMEKGKEFLHWIDDNVFGGLGVATGAFNALGQAIKAVVVVLGTLAGLAVIGRFTGLFRLAALIGRIRAGTSMLNRIPGVGPAYAGGGAAGAAGGAAGAAGAAGTAGRAGAAASLEQQALLFRAAVQTNILALEQLTLAFRIAAAAFRTGGLGGAAGKVAGARGAAARGAAGAGAAGGVAGAAGRAEQGAAGAARQGLLRRGGARLAGGVAAGGAAVAGAAGAARSRVAGRFGRTPRIVPDPTNRIIQGTDRALLGGAAGAGAAGAGAAGAGRLAAARGLASRAGGLLGRGLGRVGNAALIYSLGSAAGDLVSGGQKTGARAVAGNIVKYGATGAAIGSVIPFIGTGAGAAIGAAYGAIKNTVVGKAIDKGISAIKNGIGKLFGADDKPKSAGQKDLDTLTSNAQQNINNFGNALLLGGKRMKENREEAAKVGLAQTDLARRAAAAGISTKDLTTAITGNEGSFNKLVEAWKESGDPSDDTIAALRKLHEQYEAGNERAKKYSDATFGVIESERKNGSMLDLVSGKLGNFNQQNLTGKQAAGEFKSRLDEVTESVKKNGTSMDTTSIFGRRNASALTKAATAALQHSQAVYKSTGSVEKAQAALREDRTNILAAADALGLNRGEVNKIINRIIVLRKTPKGFKVTVNTGAAERQLSDFGSWYSGYISNISSNNPVRPWITSMTTVPGTGGKARVATTPNGGTVFYGSGGKSVGGYARDFSPKGPKDTVQRWLEPDEYVIRSAAADRLGPKALSALNRADTVSYEQLVSALSGNVAAQRGINANTGQYAGLQNTGWGPVAPKSLPADLATINRLKKQLKYEEDSDTSRDSAIRKQIKQLSTQIRFNTSDQIKTFRDKKNRSHVPDKARADTKQELAMLAGINRRIGGETGGNVAAMRRAPGARDTMQRWLEPTEYVLRTAAAKSLGPDLLGMLNNADKTSSSALVDALMSAPGLQQTQPMMPRVTPNAGVLAAQGATTNNTGFHVENLNINNPLQERASDSLPRRVRQMGSVKVGPRS